MALLLSVSGFVSLLAFTALPPIVPVLDTAKAAAPVLVSPAWGGGYARVLRLSDGSLLGSVTAYQGGTNRLRVTRSTNNGASFVDIGEIAQAQSASHDLDNVHIVQLQATAPGATVPRLIAAFRNHDGTASTGYQTFRITLCRSDDGGVTWAFHATVETSSEPNGLWEPFLFVAPDNSLQVYYARELAPNDQDIVMRRSYDGGLTWGNMTTVAGAGLTTRDGMPGVTTYWDGQQTAMLAIFESENGPFHLVISKSVDNGTTWTQRTTIYVPPNNLNAGSPQIAFVGSRLVIVFMTDENSSQHNWPDFAQVKMMSTNWITPDSINWTSSAYVAGPSAYWPGVYKSDDANAFITYVSGPSYLISVPVAAIGH